MPPMPPKRSEEPPAAAGAACAKAWEMNTCSSSMRPGQKVPGKTLGLYGAGWDAGLQCELHRSTPQESRMAGREHTTLLDQLVAAAIDSDPAETQEWIDALQAVVREGG